MAYQRFYNFLLFFKKKLRISRKNNKISPVQHNTNYINNTYKIEKSTFVNSNDSKVNVGSTDKNLNELRITLCLYCNIIEIFIDNVMEIYVKIAEQSPEMKVYLLEQKETQHFVAQINIYMKLTDRKVVYNRKFFDYFEDPY